MAATSGTFSSVVCNRCGERLAADARFCGACGNALDPNLNRVVGGRYVVRERIGVGSLGHLYRAEQLGTGRKLAIKLLAPEAKNDPQLVRRFRREGLVLSRLRSPHTVTIYDATQDADGTLFIAMELSPGTSLAEVFRVEGAFAWPRVLRIILGLCDSLGEAHALGIVHRDLKPENILLESRPGVRAGIEADFVKVTDFGLVKLMHGAGVQSAPGTKLGTVAFGSPEQLTARPIDPRSDLYSIGVLAYMLLAGRHPFAEAQQIGDLITAHVERIPPRIGTYAEVPADVEALVATCLEKDPDRRFPDTATLAAMANVALNAAGGFEGKTIPSDPVLVGDEATELAGTPPPKRR